MEQSVRPEQLGDRPALGALRGPELDIVSLAAEQQSWPATRVAVSPLLQDSLVVDNKAVLVTGAGKNEVDLEPGRNLAGLWVEEETGAAGYALSGCPPGKRAGSACACRPSPSGRSTCRRRWLQQARNREHPDRLTTLSPGRLADYARLGHGGHD